MSERALEEQRQRVGKEHWEHTHTHVHAYIHVTRFRYAPPTPRCESRMQWVSAPVEVDGGKKMEIH